MISALKKCAVLSLDALSAVAPVRVKQMVLFGIANEGDAQDGAYADWTFTASYDGAKWDARDLLRCALCSLQLRPA